MSQFTDFDVFEQRPRLSISGSARMEPNPMSNLLEADAPDFFTSRGDCHRLGSPPDGPAYASIQQQLEHCGGCLPIHP